MTQQAPEPRARDQHQSEAHPPRKLFDFSATEDLIHDIYDRIRGNPAGTIPDRTYAGPPPIVTVPEHQPLADGTRILIAGTGAPLDHETMFRFLDEQRAAIPDLVLVHTRASGAESLAEQWAGERNVPQIMYPPDPYGEAERQRSARHLGIFNITPPEHVYDFSETGRRSALSEIAYTRNLPVTVMRHMLQYACIPEIRHDPIDRRPTVAPGIPATRGEQQELAASDHQIHLDALRAEHSHRIHPLAIHDPRALGPTYVEGARPPFDGLHFVVTGSTTSPDPANIFRYLDERFPLGEADSYRPDLIFIHTGETLAERTAGEWAAANDIPQIVYAPHPDGETLAQRSARLHALLDHAGPRAVHDFSLPGEQSDLAVIAGNYHRLVILSAERLNRSLARGRETTDDLVENFLTGHRANQARARSASISPYATDEWPALHRSLNGLVQRSDVPPKRREVLLEIHQDYRDWRLKQARAEKQEPQDQSPRQSHRFR